MKPRTRIPARRRKPRRKRPELFFKRELSQFLDPRSYVTKGGRVRLFGLDYVALQLATYRRAKGFCECGCANIAPWAVLTDIYIPLENKGEVSHDEHGARKSDELDRVKWMRHECHMRLHNPKACPPKEAA